MTKSDIMCASERKFSSTVISNLLTYDLDFVFREILKASGLEDEKRGDVLVMDTIFTVITIIPNTTTDFITKLNQVFKTELRDITQEFMQQNPNPLFPLDSKTEKQIVFKLPKKILFSYLETCVDALEDEKKYSYGVLTSKLDEFKLNTNSTDVYENLLCQIAQTSHYKFHLSTQTVSYLLNHFNKSLINLILSYLNTSSDRMYAASNEINQSIVNMGRTSFRSLHNDLSKTRFHIKYGSGIRFIA